MTKAIVVTIIKLQLLERKKLSRPCMVYKVEEIFQLVRELFNKLCPNILVMDALSNFTQGSTNVLQKLNKIQ
jgi:hypothetical protein